MEPRRVVLELPVGEAGAKLLLAARRRGFERFLFPGDAPARPSPGSHLFLREGRQLRASDGSVVGEIRSISGPEELHSIEGGKLDTPLLLLEFEGERLIPLENLLSAPPRGTELWVRARRAEELPGILGALERGSDAAVLAVGSESDLALAEEVLERPLAQLRWKRVRVRQCRPGGLGERVIVDTTSRLTPQEGLLVGSQAGLLLLTLSEALGSRYTRPRAFRVNAGALHSYTLLSDGQTRYLDELEAGDRVVIASPEGSPRSVRVGRLKVERRPLRLIQVEDGSRVYSLFSQEAETVRLAGGGGALPIPDVAPGDEVWAVELPRARHFGRPVEESVEER